MDNGKRAPASEAPSGDCSRRRALAMMLGAWRCCCVVPAAADSGAPVRLAISESVMGDVNLNDARAAMLIWIKRMMADLNVVIDFNPKVFDTAEEIVDRARKGQLDAVALNVLEYRPIADLVDPSQIVTVAGAAGMEQYLILAKQNSGIAQLGDLKGRRLAMLKTPKMCIAPAWLSTILDAGHYGPAEQFFGTVATDAKVSRVVLPVFFGQAEAGLASKQGFDTMCELNPQVSRDLRVLATSPPLVVMFYAFCKNYQGAQRAKLIRALSSLCDSPAGRQLATLFQFDELTVRDGGCLASALGILEAADRVRSRRGAGNRKG